jgi:hypothetical protein
MDTTRGLAFAAGLLLLAAETSLDVNCSLAELSMGSDRPSICFRRPCQSLVDYFPQHVHSEPDTETPSTVSLISASGATTNSTVGMYSYRFGFDKP